MTCAHALARAVAAHGQPMHLVFVHGSAVARSSMQRHGAGERLILQVAACVASARLQSAAVPRRRAAYRSEWPPCGVACAAASAGQRGAPASVRCVCVCVICFCTAVSTRGLSISDIGCHVAAALGLHMFGQSNPCVMAWQSDGNATSSAAAEGKVRPISGLEKWSVFAQVRPDSGHKNEASFTNNLHKI